MNTSDLKKLDEIRKTFDLNYKITQLYSTYLNHFPELISADMIEDMCCDGKITKKDALVAIICEAFGLNTPDADGDNAKIRNIIRRSVKILDTKKYTENPYYKNIPIKNVKDGNWELRHEVYPAYRGMICDDLITREDFSEVPPLAFFSEDFHFPAVLEGGNEWMTLTPIDLDTCENGINRAHGKVVTFGLGLGYFAYMVSRKKSVDSVTVVEKSRDVISLFERYILPYFECKEKVRIICKDAFLYAEEDMPNEKFDYAFVDTWRDASDGAPMYMRMKALEPLNPGTKFDYWIESFLVSRLRAERFEKLYEKVISGAQDSPASLDEFIKGLNIYGKNT